jgi:hypothetical protein
MMDVEMIGWVNMNMQQQTLLKPVPGGEWIRAADTFSLDAEDVEIITPANGALQNLPIGVGAVLLTLGPETKGQSSKRVDAPLADTFASGISCFSLDSPRPWSGRALIAPFRWAGAWWGTFLSLWKIFRAWQKECIARMFFKWDFFKG